MSDFESRLHDTLVARAEEAPDALDLAGGARRRLRRRRTARTVLAVAVMAVAIPLGIGQLAGAGRGADDDTFVATDVPGDPDVGDDGLRRETWHGVSVQVPDDWGHGGPSGWCSTGDRPEDVTPVVARPDTPTLMIACTPANGYGLVFGPMGRAAAYESGLVTQFESTGERPAYAQGGWGSYWHDPDDADLAFLVVTPDRELTQRIIDSATRVAGVDPNGCPAEGGAAGVAPAERREGVSLCRYDRDGLLAASGLLTDERATAAMEALASSPTAVTGDRCPSNGLNSADTFRDGTHVLQDGVLVAATVLGPCGGVIFEGTTHEMTADVRALVDGLG